MFNIRIAYYSKRVLKGICHELEEITDALKCCQTNSFGEIHAKISIYSYILHFRYDFLDIWSSLAT